MKKIIKSLSLFALLPVLSLGVTSCGSSAAEVKDVKSAAHLVSESVASTPSVYKQQAEKSDYFSLKTDASLSITTETSKSTADLTGQLVVNPNFIIELTKEEPNMENLTLIDSMYIGASLYSKDDTEEMNSLIELGVYDDVGYAHTKSEYSDEENNEEYKEKLVNVNDWLLGNLGFSSSYKIGLSDSDYVSTLNELGPAALAWLSEEMDSSTFVDTVGQVVFADDKEMATQFNTYKPLIVNVADVARTNINTLFTIKGNENSFSISTDSEKTVAFLNSIKSYSDEQASKTEGTEALFAPFYLQVSSFIEAAIKQVPTYSVTLSLSFQDKAIVGLGFNVTFVNDTVSVKANFSVELSFKKIDVTKMTGLDEYELVEDID